MVSYIAIPAIILVQTVLIAILLFERSRLGRLQSEREKSADALKESEAKNRAILAALPDMMFLLNEKGTYLDWYAQDTSNLYAPPEEFLGRNMRDVLPSQLAGIFAEKFRQVLSSAAPASVEYSMVLQNEVRFFEARIVRCGDRKLLSIVRDLTEKKRSEMELQQLSSRLLSLQDDERRRIARELHGTTAQNLFAVTINLQNLKQQGNLTPTAIEILNECHDLCERSLQEVRTLSYLLHPPELKRTGLIPTLQWYVAGFAKRTGIAVTFEATPDVDRLPAEMEVDLFRVVQEGLFNVFKHSGSRSANVRVEKCRDEIVLRIKDSGNGLRNWNAHPENGPQLGVGIPSIRERLRRLGGNLRIESHDDGVILVAQVSVPPKGRVSAAGGRE